MSQSTEKKLRRERKKTIAKFIENNKDMVLKEVIKTLRAGKLTEKVAFCFLILFGRK